MFAVDVYAAVRDFVCDQGKGRREAARVFGLSRETIAKMCRFSLPPGYTRTKSAGNTEAAPGIVAPSFNSMGIGRDSPSRTINATSGTAMHFMLNGKAAAIPEALADDRLLWVLRDHFALNGPKYGCGVGACGACTIHVDGVAQRACLLTAANIQGRLVTTLEGLGANAPGGLHPVQQAWIECAAPQCGYCQNGQIMTAAALLNADATAAPAEVAAAMDSVICRCGTQARIGAALRLAQTRMRGGA